jgi:hypothetical protein
MPEPFRYHAYGLTLATHLPLPCRRASTRTRPDVRLVEGTSTDFARACASVGGMSRQWFHHVRLADGSAYLRWRDNFEFLVSPSGRVIRYRRLAHATFESLTVYLLGQIISFSLIARGRDPLHGTSVALGASAVAFVGDCGYGKSTLAAALLARGGRIVTDDLVSLQPHRAGWIVQPGVPRLKLAPTAMAALLGDVAATPMIHGVDKRVISLTPRQAVARPLPLRAIYVLGSPRRGAKVVVEPLARADAFLEIIRAAFNLVVHDRRRYVRQFVLATQLADAVPVRRVTYPRRFAALADVCDAVQADADACDAAR